MIGLLVAVTGKAPFDTLITHGFVLDEQGRKMSKSLGNIVEPERIIQGGKVVIYEYNLNLY
jgi:isoleucyl-tRNA synthetase